jgi:hypothetical protein
VAVVFGAFVVFQNRLNGVAELAGIESRVGRREWSAAGAAGGIRALSVREEGRSGDATSVTNEEIREMEWIFDF